MAFRWY